MNHQVRWTASKIERRLNLIAPHVHRHTHPLPPFDYQPLDGPEAMPAPGGDWTPLPPHTYWGSWQTDFALRATFTIPAGWPADAPLALYLPLGDAGDFSHPEALVQVDGAALAGSDRHHHTIDLPASVHDGQPHTLTLRGWTGLGGSLQGDQETRLYMRPCAVVQIDTPTRDFIATARVALGVANTLAEDDPARARLFTALDDAFRLLDTRDPLGDAFYASVPAAHQTLRAGVVAAGPALDVDIVAAGHAHIDIAWLWTVAQARRKAQRTFHTVLRLMEQFDDYRFTQSQPQLYDYIRQDDPALFDAIKARVADGRWEPIGGMWVEADCNLSGAEALARQFLLGRTFFRDHFGRDAESPVLWLPDVFGYAWNLPQLIKEAGLDYFFTIKISWSQYNRIPYDTFWWQGLDGTRVLTHFSTTQDGGQLSGVDTRPSTYNARVTPFEVMRTWRNLQQKEQRHLLLAFGYGDGGGGPTREMLENIRELGDFPATPRVHHGRAVDFFDAVAAGGDALPVWNGELYLEYHRGTYTTQARTKRANRKNEFLLHDAEFLAAWAAVATDAAYPQAALREAWQRLCLNQFHDILPGSSIGPVYDDAAGDYARIETIGVQVRDGALDALSATLPAGSDLIVVNPTSFAYAGLGRLDTPLPRGTTVVDLADGTPLATQAVDGATLIALPPVGPYGMRALRLSDAADAGAAPIDTAVTCRRTADTVTLENDRLRAVFDRNGELTTLYDKEHDRHVLPEGARANVWQAFEDRPLDWDAWDVEIYYDDRPFAPDPAHHLAVVEDGPLRAGFEIRRRLGASEIVQRITLARDSRRLDFATHIDWQERHVLLKVAFPVDILSPAATYDVQWGNVERPTHRNTSWDWARFETCAHKWVDLSEGDYGVSLLNDCKYGHDVLGNVIRLTVLRGPTFPDPSADLGPHRFTYSLLPHPGDWRGATAAEAYALNDPPLVRRVTANDAGPAGDGASAQSLVAVDSPHVIIETVKQAEDGDGMIVRLYENERTRGAITLRTAFPLRGAYRCNLLEENATPLECDRHTVRLAVKPYQIVTVRLRPARKESSS